MPPYPVTQFNTGYAGGRSAFSASLLTALFILNLNSPCLASTIGSSRVVDFPASLIRKDRMTFEQISPDQGLSQSTINCIVQDHRGFMWFGTDDGLNRYDGYDFRVYRFDPEDPNSLSDHLITSICEDNGGDLWIGTQNGLNRYNPETETFSRFLADPDNPRSLSHNQVQVILEDRRGELWIGTAEGLNRFDRAREEFRQFRHDPHDPRSLSHDFVRALGEDNAGILWVGTINGLNRAIPSAVDGSNISFARYYSDPEETGSLVHNSILSIYSDRSGNLWIGTAAGLNRMNSGEKGNTPPRFVRYRHDPGDPYSLGNNQVMSIYEDIRGTIWIGTWEGGLNRYDPAEDRFTRFRNDRENPSSLSNDVVRSIYEDRSGIFWVGTSSGLNRYDRQKGAFSLYRSEAGNPNSLSSDMIWSICEDRDGSVWIGTGGGGLDRLIPGGIPSFIHYQNDPGDPTSLSSNFITVVEEDSEGSIWVGTDGFGLNRLVSGTGDISPSRFRRYLADPGDPRSLSGNIIMAILEDRSGNIWIGTGGGGLSKLAREEREKTSATFRRYRNDPGDGGSLSHNFIHSLFEDRSGLLWIGTNGGGLNRLVPGDHDSIPPSFDHFVNDPDVPGSLSDNRVLSIHEDRAGVLWVGTSGGGLNRFDRETGLFLSYRMKQGLPSDVVYAIVEDDQGFLWLSTNNGVSKFDPRSESFKNYDVSDGLQGNEFNSGAYFRGRSGLIYFGGINGLNVFHPDSICDDPHVPQVVITDFKLFNRSIPIGREGDGDPLLERSITESREIVLSHGENSLSFEFAALHYSSPERNRYAYTLEGFDTDWNYVGTRRVATYTNLPSGEYEFRVIASNHDDVWNEAGTSIRIVIVPPFWESRSFRTAALLFIALAVYILYRIRIRGIESKRRELEQRVAERTLAAEALQGALGEVEQLKNRLEVENVYLQDEIKVDHNFENIITQSPLFKKVLRDLEKVASTDATVLVLGESGTGKELLARAVHNISPRGDRALVKVNCSALPANLIESELFGHEKGAFTGALSRKTGRFEVADGGTIFLDEIGDLPIELQAKLLRVLQEGEFERLGSSKSIRVDVRVIAATNRDLEKAIERNNFREDLYYRIHVFPITIPPLRDRKEDIPLLVNHFVQNFGKKTGKQIETIPQGVLDRLLDYDWPGNVRELENIIERAVIITTGNQLVIGDWLPKSTNSNRKGIQTLTEVERDHIIRALERTGWRVSGKRGAAVRLGINPKTLDSRMRKLGIKRPV